MAIAEFHRVGLVLLAGAGLVAVPPVVEPGPDAVARMVALTGVDGADSPLGGGTALVLGPSGVAGQPAQGYLDAVDQLYLAPRGFTGTVQGVATPEGLNPITGVKSLPFDNSEAQGQQILDSDIVNLYHSGQVDAANPVVVYGYSQSSVIASQLMQQLTDQGVPSDDVHFVLVANESAPNGGALSSFDMPVGTHPSAPALGVTFTGAEPSNLYPTDVYSLEYDGFSDFPRYPIDELSTLNALFGVIFQHLGYLGVSPDQIADAVHLSTSAADTLTNYYVIPDQYLPLLEPLLLFGSGGKVLYDLLEPDMRVLVDLGYGSLDEGWNQGPADVATPVGFLPTGINLSDLLTALTTGAQQGIAAATADLQNPDLGQTAQTEMDDILQPLVTAGHAVGWTDATTPEQLLSNFPELLQLLQNVLTEFANWPVSTATLTSPLTDIVSGLSGMFSGDYATAEPIADTLNALLTAVPSVVLNELAAEFAGGDPLGGIGDAIGGVAGIVPFAVTYGAIIPVVESLGGTLVSLVDLFQ